MKILIIIAVNLAFFTRTIWYGYVSDDCMASGAKEPIFKNKLHYFWIHFIGLRFANSKFTHSLNLIVHTATCVLVYLVMLKLFHMQSIAFLTALFCSINPVNTQGGSVWIAGKLYASSAMFTLLMFLLPYISPLFYLFSIQFFTVSAIPSPLLFIPTKLWYLSFLLPIGIIVLRKKIVAQQFLIKADTATPVMKEFKPYKIILFLKTFAYYTLLAIWPMRLGHYHQFLYEWGVSEQDNKDGRSLDLYFWIGLLLAPAMATVMFLNWRNPLGFGIWWWFVAITPWCNIITIQMCVAERYVYLPAIGLMLSLAYVISLLPAPYNYVLATAFLSFYATKLWIHTPAYKDERALAFRNHFDFPDFYYPYSWIGMFYKDQGRRYEALGWWTDALDRRPLDFKVLFNLSHMMGELGYLKEANELLEKVKKSLIPNGLEKNLLAMIENRQKHVRAAIEQSQIATQNQIIELAKNIKKGEQLK